MGEVAHAATDGRGLQIRRRVRHATRAGGQPVPALTHATLAETINFARLSDERSYESCDSGHIILSLIPLSPFSEDVKCVYLLWLV